MNIKFNYKNHHREIREREVDVDSIEFLFVVGYGYQPGWFISGFDIEKAARRTFALSHIVFPEDSLSRARFVLMNLKGL